MKMFKMIGVLGIVAVMAGCQDLNVENINAPDAAQALQNAGDVESLLGTAYYRTAVNGTQKNASVYRRVLGEEYTMTWGNWGAQEASRIPPLAWDNSPTASYTIGVAAPWSNIYEGLSNAADALFALEQGLEFDDDDGMDTEGRAWAFGRFAQGVGHGWLALFHDQAFVFDEQTLATLDEQEPQLLPADELMDVAMGYFEEALQYAQNAGPFQLPATWIHGNTLNNQELQQWIHSYMALYKSIMPRTPAERAAVDWDEVIMHLENGVHDVAGYEGEQTEGVIWWSRTVERPDSWMRAHYNLIGPADTSGAYEAWLATPPDDREVFWIETADRRITGADGPDTPGTRYRPASPPNVFPADRGGHAQSRYFNYWTNPREQPGGLDWATMQPRFTPEQRDLRHAEALLRLNRDRDLAVDLINNSRVNNGQMEPLPYSVGDDELWETLAYELFLEQAGTIGSVIYFDRRGLGNLKCGAALQFPIPGGELELLQMPDYTFGGQGPGAAEPGSCRTPDQPGNIVNR